MTDDSFRWAIGLMSGTSLNGIDAALLRSDGQTVAETGLATTTPYDEMFRAGLRGLLGGEGHATEIERDMTLRHARAVEALLAKSGLDRAEIAVIGFHGHTIQHEPEKGRTRQIGDGALLAAEVGIDVVADFRSRDMAEGGEGAPFAPLYHAALASGLERPLAVLKLGGVGNLTWIGPGDGQVLAFDSGPGNALVDDWVAARAGLAYDRGGALAATGQVAEDALAKLMADDYFGRPPPKSLDREAFDIALVSGLSREDGAATLTAFTAAAVAAGAAHFPEPILRCLVTGGGRHNATLMAMLAGRLDAPVEPVEAVGWDGDALEAQAFAYLALRAIDGLPLSLPSTTGVKQPTTGGVLHRAA
jgi:anhydro-N-acetylmuramic acid kinase